MTSADSAESECDVTYKILLLGDSGVGKTSLIRSLTGAKFSPRVISTVGIDFVKVVFLVDGVRVRLQIWDTAGQERFRSITKFQYRGTKGLLLVYDVTQRQTFDMLNYWINDIEKDVSLNKEESIPMLVIGNKCDLLNERVVSTAEGRKISERNVMSGFWETSAAESINVTECFTQLAKKVLEQNNPELMDMYKYSSAIDREKNRIYLHATLTNGHQKEEERTTSIKLRRKRDRLKCDCARTSS